MNTTKRFLNPAWCLAQVRLLRRVQLLTLKLTNMERLVVLDYASNSVLFIPLTKDDVKNIEENYEFDYESWIADSGLEKKFGFDIDNSNWMFADDMLSIYDCNPNNGEMKRLYLNKM